MNCTKCGTEIGADTKFCTKCGQKNIALSEAKPEQKTWKTPFLSWVIRLVVFVIAFGGARYLTQEIFSPSNAGTSITPSSTSSSSTSSTSQYTPSEIAAEAVRQAKASTVFPSKMDELTTWTDITAEGNAIRYHYSLSSDVDTNDLTSSYLKNFIVTGICENKATRSLLDDGVYLQYSYIVEDFSKTYFFTITKSDCQ
jgi:hypothetical protein